MMIRNDVDDNEALMMEHRVDNDNGDKYKAVVVEEDI
jgi:hypothetical protein